MTRRCARVQFGHNQSQHSVQYLTAGTSSSHILQICRSIFLLSLSHSLKHRYLRHLVGFNSTLPAYSWYQIYFRQQGQVELNSGKWGKGPFLVQLSSELVFPCTPCSRHVDNQTVFLKNKDWFDQS